MGRLFPGEDPPPPPPSAATPDGAGPGPFIVSCATLAGERVIDVRGDEVGVLVHVMVDMPSGRIACGVLARGGVFGVGEKLLAIPWASFTLDPVRRRLMLALDRGRLDEAPAFDPERP